MDNPGIFQSDSDPNNECNNHNDLCLISASYCDGIILNALGHRRECYQD